MKSNEFLLGNEHFIEYLTRFVYNDHSINANDIKRDYSNNELNKYYKDYIISIWGDKEDKQFICDLSYDHLVNIRRLIQRQRIQYVMDNFTFPSIGNPNEHSEEFAAKVHETVNEIFNRKTDIKNFVYKNILKEIKKKEKENLEDQGSGSYNIEDDGRFLCDPLTGFYHEKIHIKGREVINGYSINKWGYSSSSFEVFELVDKDGNIIIGNAEKLCFIDQDIIKYTKKVRSSRWGIDDYDQCIINLITKKKIWKNEISTPYSYDISKYSDGLLKIELEENKTIFIDKNGKRKLAIKGSGSLGDFNEGLLYCSNQKLFLFDSDSLKEEELFSISSNYFNHIMHEKINKERNRVIDYKKEAIIESQKMKKLKLRPFLKQNKIESENSFLSYTEELFGYEDDKNNIIIEPKFFQAGKFSEGFAAVGYFDGTYDQVIAKKTIKLKKRHWGYIDKNGDLKIKLDVLGVYDFKNGLAVVTDHKEGKWLYGIIDKKGNYVILPVCRKITEIENGKFYLLEKENIGFLDINGKWQIKPNYEFAENFKNGECLVIKNNKVFKINKKGNKLRKKF